MKKNKYFPFFIILIVLFLYNADCGVCQVDCHDGYDFNHNGTIVKKTMFQSCPHLEAQTIHKNINMNNYWIGSIPQGQQTVFSDVTACTLITYNYDATSRYVVMEENYSPINTILSEVTVLEELTTDVNASISAASSPGPPVYKTLKKYSQRIDHILNGAGIITIDKLNSERTDYTTLVSNETTDRHFYDYNSSNDFISLDLIKDATIEEYLDIDIFRIFIPETGTYSFKVTYMYVNSTNTDHYLNVDIYHNKDCDYEYCNNRPRYIVNKTKSRQEGSNNYTINLSVFLTQGDNFIRVVDSEFNQESTIDNVFGNFSISQSDYPFSYKIIMTKN